MYIIYVKYIPTQIIHVQINKYFCIDRKRTFYNYLKTFLSIGLSFFYSMVYKHSGIQHDNTCIT